MVPCWDQVNKDHFFLDIFGKETTVTKSYSNSSLFVLNFDHNFRLSKSKVPCDMDHVFQIISAVNIRYTISVHSESVYILCF